MSKEDDVIGTKRMLFVIIGIIILVGGIVGGSLLFIISGQVIYEDEYGNAIFIKNDACFAVKKTIDGKDIIYKFEKNGSNFESLNNYSADTTIRYQIQLKDQNNVCYLLSVRSETNGVVFREKFVKTVSLDLWYLGL